MNFKLDIKEITETLIIDPWVVTSTSVLNVNNLYDIDYDSEGNVYVYGEINAFSEECTLFKFDPNGNLIWIFQPSIFNNSPYYGDFVIDKQTNTIFLTQGFNGDGAQILKLDKDAEQLAYFPGDINFAEMWRIAISNCSNQAVIAGGGTSSPTYQTCFLDFGLQNLTLVQYIQTDDCCHDVNMLAIDNNGSCFQVTNKSVGGDGSIFDNKLAKLPMPNLQPYTYSVSTGYHLNEGGSNIFYMNLGGENGYNGITTFQNYVYTYDSHILKKWDSNNGNNLNQKIINQNIIDTSLVNWGGLAVDFCGLIYLGFQDSVFIYDTNLVLIQKIKMLGNVIDLVINFNGDILTCGKNFVSVLKPENISICPTLTYTITKQDKFCSTLGSAKININGGNPPYSIVWNTIPPQFTDSLSNLEIGNYTVVIKDANCNGKVIFDTIKIVDVIENNYQLNNVNVFTPNNDSKNDFFYPFTEMDNIGENIEQYKLLIFNRWGNLIFETTNPNLGWNGLIDNKKVEDGVYFWKVNVKSLCIGEKEYNGFFHLINNN